MASGPGELLELQEDSQLADLVKNWNFKPGKDFQARIAYNFRSSVHHPSSSPAGAFHLLAVFRRFTFRLTEASVSLALHACLGGAPAGFHVTYLQDRHFRFYVSSKKVGLAVRALNRITTNHFDVYFHMWRDGGDNWSREKSCWERDEAASWTPVLSRKAKKEKARASKFVSFRRRLVQDSPLKKSEPSELKSLIKIGSVYCPLIPPNLPLVCGKFQKSNFETQIPATKVFARIKADLSTAVPASNYSNHETFTSCSRCLARGHQVSDCGNSIRCRWCFDYGHKALTCLKKRSCLKSKWEPKSTAVVDVRDAYIEPRTPQKDVTKACNTADALTQRHYSSHSHRDANQSIPSSTPALPLVPDHTEETNTAQQEPSPAMANFVVDQFIQQMPQVKNNEYNNHALDKSSNADSMIQDAQTFTQDLAETSEMQIDIQLPKPTLMEEQTKHQSAIEQQHSSMSIQQVLPNPMDSLHGNTNKNILIRLFLTKIQKLMDCCTIKMFGNPILQANGISNSTLSFSINKLGVGTVTIKPTEIQPAEVREPDTFAISSVFKVSKKEPIITINNQIIQKIYYRKRFRRNQASSNAEMETTTIFGAVQGDYTPLLPSCKRKLISNKRKVTPVSTQHLRRSTRSKTTNDGFKASYKDNNTGPVTRSRSKLKGKSVASPSVLTDKLLLPNICSSVDFPSLDELDKLAAANNAYPEISVSELQQVAIQRCGLPPMEVSTELLLSAPRRDNGEEGASSQHNQLVPYG